MREGNICHNYSLHDYKISAQKRTSARGLIEKSQESKNALNYINTYLPKVNKKQ